MSIILRIIGKKKKEIPESIIGIFWSITDLSLEEREATTFGLQARRSGQEVH